MDLKEIKLLIDLMKKNDLSVLKIEEEGFKVTLKKNTGFQPVISHSAPAAPVAAAPAPAAATPAAPAAKEDEGRQIVSPTVGTFYMSPKPELPPFVTVGQEVTPDTVVCIIEAMKIMNEIKAETSGVIAEIVAENGKPVQFGQTLFKLK
ncbi:MAG TPA: acetyl-CoA carboxylase biotin carboxyl carrier protein [Chthoniobacteraceae bacterium]|nr:acetyl-CoA carboxylase biotin carboxyl carrier protein [Chthoniobacteraceae bacterium]